MKKLLLAGLVLVAIIALLGWAFQNNRAFDDACRDAGGVTIGAETMRLVCVDRSTLIEVTR